MPREGDGFAKQTVIPAERSESRDPWNMTVPFSSKTPVFRGSRIAAGAASGMTNEFCKAVAKAGRPVNDDVFD
jgi:hypothetical protein